MKTFIRFLLVLVVIFISAAAVIEYVKSNKLRSENHLLAAEVASLKTLQETTSEQQHKGGEGISKAEQKELLRLRSEVSQLRARKADLERLRSENQRLKQSFDSERNDVQTRWKLRLPELRTNAQPADYLALIPEMNEALTNNDPWVRAEAAKVLRDIGLKRLLNTNLTAQESADLKSAAKAAVPGLLPVLKDPDPVVCANAAITLGFLHEDIEQVIPALVENLNSEQWRIAGSAAKALGRLQGDASSAVPALIQLARSSNPDLRAAAVEALKEIDPTATRNVGFE